MSSKFITSDIKTNKHIESDSIDISVSEARNVLSKSYDSIIKDNLIEFVEALEEISESNPAAKHNETSYMSIQGGRIYY